VLEARIHIVYREIADAASRGGNRRREIAPRPGVLSATCSRPGVESAGSVVLARPPSEGPGSTNPVVWNVESAPASGSAPGRTSVLAARSQGNAATSAFMRRVFAVERTPSAWRDCVQLDCVQLVAGAVFSLHTRTGGAHDMLRAVLGLRSRRRIA
jgi:hypothetical protein